MLSFPLEAAAARAELAEDYPRLHTFLERIRARPAYLHAEAVKKPQPIIPAFAGVMAAREVFVAWT